VATRDFYQQVVDFAKTNKIVVVQDAAHIMLTFAGDPLSFLSVTGAKDVGVEVHSMSKGFDMIGWRIGWVCGHQRLVSAFADVKDNCDSGQFIAIQKAAITALDDDAIPVNVREKYRRRMSKLVATLSRCGINCQMPGGSYFLYVANPKGVENGPTFDTAEAASQYLITEQSIVTVPWDDAGPFLRFSVTYEAADEAAEDALMAETEARLRQMKLVY
jgi:LL-diaminopimelate aminotransferase